MSPLPVSPKSWVPQVTSRGLLLLNLKSGLLFLLSSDPFPSYPSVIYSPVTSLHSALLLGISDPPTLVHCLSTFLPVRNTFVLASSTASQFSTTLTLTPTLTYNFNLCSFRNSLRQSLHLFDTSRLRTTTCLTWSTSTSSTVAGGYDLVLVSQAGRFLPYASWKALGAYRYGLPS